MLAGLQIHSERDANFRAETRVAPVCVSPLPPRSQVFYFVLAALRVFLRVSAPPRHIHCLFGTGFSESRSGHHYASGNARSAIRSRPLETSGSSSARNSSGFAP